MSVFKHHYIMSEIVYSGVPQAVNPEKKIVGPTVQGNLCRKIRAIIARVQE